MLFYFQDIGLNYTLPFLFFIFQNLYIIFPSILHSLYNIKLAVHFFYCLYSCTCLSLHINIRSFNYWVIVVIILISINYLGCSSYTFPLSIDAEYCNHIFKVHLLDFPNLPILDFLSNIHKNILVIRLVPLTELCIFFGKSNFIYDKALYKWV
jgi:hypothetical protein